MANYIFCTNSRCKYYFEDDCIKNLNNERVEINYDGKCETFEYGVFEGYAAIEAAEQEEPCQ